MTSPYLTSSDIESILWDLKTLSIFFPEPLEVSIPGHKSMTVGDGYGGFSWSFFQRGFECTACGNCCQSLHGEFNRRLWFWYENEPRPEGLIPLEIEINSSRVPIYIHLNESKTQCDFLGDRSWVPIDDDIVEQYQSHKIKLVETGDKVPIQSCTIHDPLVKPAHCMMYPGAAIFPTGKSKTLLLSRRLPGRNWRWPQCPIDVTNVPLRPQDTSLDRYVLGTWAKATRHVPGNDIDKAISLWELATFNTTHGQPPTESIQFAKIWS